MQAVTKGLLLAALLLASCHRSEPDFQFRVPASHGENWFVISGYQPRGTIEGVLLLSFGNRGSSRPEVATFHSILNGSVGWISDMDVAVIADKLVYQNISSDYFPDGTMRTKIRLIVCVRGEMDCSSIEGKLAKESALKIIHRFPEAS
jgi:hypothetical protein